MTTRFKMGFFIGIFQVSMGIILANTGANYASLGLLSVVPYFLGVFQILTGAWMITKEASS